MTKKHKLIGIIIGASVAVTALGVGLGVGLNPPSSSSVPTVNTGDNPTPPTNPVTPTNPVDPVDPTTPVVPSGPAVLRSITKGTAANMFVALFDKEPTITPAALETLIREDFDGRPFSEVNDYAYRSSVVDRTNPLQYIITAELLTPATTTTAQFSPQTGTATQVTVGLTKALVKSQIEVNTFTKLFTDLIDNSDNAAFNIYEYVRVITKNSETSYTVGIRLKQQTPPVAANTRAVITNIEASSSTEGEFIATFDKPVAVGRTGLFETIRNVFTYSFPAIRGEYTYRTAVRNPSNNLQYIITGELVPATVRRGIYTFNNTLRVQFNKPLLSSQKTDTALTNLLRSAFQINNTPFTLFTFDSLIEEVEPTIYSVKVEPKAKVTNVVRVGVSSRFIVTLDKNPRLSNDHAVVLLRESFLNNFPNVVGAFYPILINAVSADGLTYNVEARETPAAYQFITKISETEFRFTLGRPLTTTISLQTEAQLVAGFKEQIDNGSFIDLRDYNFVSASVPNGGREVIVIVEAKEKVTSITRSSNTPDEFLVTLDVPATRDTAQVIDAIRDSFDTNPLVVGVYKFDSIKTISDDGLTYTVVGLEPPAVVRNVSLTSPNTFTILMSKRFSPAQSGDVLTKFFTDIFDNGSTYNTYNFVKVNSMPDDSTIIVEVVAK